MSDGYPTRKALYAAGEQARRNLTCPACGGTFDRELGRIRHVVHPAACKEKLLRMAEARRRAGGAA